MRASTPEPIEITGDDVAFMVYTSGTTGEPKAAINTHRNVVFATSVYERWIGLHRRRTRSSGWRRCSTSPA